MIKIDPTRSWACFDARLSQEQDPVVRQLVAQVREHMRAEICGELDALMATLTAEPVYHFWGYLPENVLSGNAAVLAFYQEMMERGGNQFEVVTHNIVADRGRVVTEGQVRQLYLGSELRAMGLEATTDGPVEDRQLYLGATQLVTVWPNDGDGKLVGEDIYFGQAPLARLEAIGLDELAQDFAWHPRIGA